jgi:DEAD/DEAH box helicase domain-containing protein
VDYYTQARGYKETEILETYDQKAAWGSTVCSGRIKVTDQITDYEIWRIHAKKMIHRVPLDLPPQLLETEGLWFKIPPELYNASESGHLDFMGGIHAIEHAAIGIFPLLMMVDRNDLGGLSTVYHPQLNTAAVFIYDGIPGGAGLNREAFKRAESLLQYTLKVIQGCGCKSGCPSCVHSPKCGSGNRPIDKKAAIFILNRLKNRAEPEAAKMEGISTPKNSMQERAQRPSKDPHYGVFDLETQRSANEVGGWHRADLMKISCAVLYDSKEDRLIDFLENQIPQFIKHLQTFNLVIGFNIKRFDFLVLKGYSDFNFSLLNTIDILEEVEKYLGFRLSLSHLAAVTLGAHKTADGLQALEWWQQGRILEIIEYCRQDVKITRDLYRYGKKNKHLLFKNREDKTVRVPVNW